MKTKLIIATLGLASVLSFGASAAVQQVNADQAQKSAAYGQHLRDVCYRLSDGYPSRTGCQS